MKYIIHQLKRRGKTSFEFGRCNDLESIEEIVSESNGVKDFCHLQRAKIYRCVFYIKQISRLCNCCKLHFNIAKTLLLLIAS